MTAAAKKTTKAAAASDYVVKDIGLAEWGRKEIAIAETEMPGLMATREEYGPEQPLRGARVAGSLLVHLGRQAEKNPSVLNHPTNEEEEVLFAAIKKRLKDKPGWYTKLGDNIKGVTEETTTGVHRLYQMEKDGRLLFPAINVNDSVTKSKFDNLYGCRESLVDGIRRGTDVMMAGKVAMIAGYGDVRKGSAASLRPAGCRVM